jgi:hypothetical protein
MNFNQQIEALNIELDKFVHLLKQTLPRYSELINKKDINAVELTELGEIEYYLIELNGKIAEVKKQLEHDLFGLSLDLYYKLKKRALAGDIKAAKKVVIMRKAFSKSLEGNSFINWN